MFQKKLTKKLAIAVAACSLANVVSFGAPLFAGAADNDVNFNFNDGVLPEVFDSSMFTVENNMLKVNDKDSLLTIDGLSENYSAEFLIKPLDGDVEKAFNLYFGNAAIYFDGANSQNSSWDDSIALNKRSDGSRITKIWANGSGSNPDGAYFPDRVNGHKVKVVVNSGIHSMFIDDVLTISGECTESAGSNSFSLSLAAFATAGVYLDDIVIENMEVAKEVLAEGALASHNFNDGKLPARFDSSKFSVENGMLKANVAGSTFAFTDVPENSITEFKIKPLDNAAVPAFSFNFGNISVSYTDNYAQNASWDDYFTIYDRTTWAKVGGQVWANGSAGIPKDTFFPANEDGHTIKTVSYGGSHKLYIDDVLIFDRECKKAAGGTNNIEFMVSTKATTGLYFDDIVVKDSTKPYTFNFESGVLSKEFDTNNFFIQDGMLRVRGADSSFEFKNMSKNASLEFKIKSADNEYIPPFYVEIGNAQVSYKNNFTDPTKGWNDEIPIYNRVNWDASQSQKVWADGGAGKPKGNFFPVNEDGYTLKYVAKDGVHSLYIDGALRLQSTLTGELSAYNIKFTVGNAATTGMYIDDIKVELLDLVPEFGATVSAEGDTKTCNVTLKNIEDTNNVIFACFKGGSLVKAEVRDCTNDSEAFTATEDIDEIKVMLWGGLTSMDPVYDAITILQSEWTAE